MTEATLSLSVLTPSETLLQIDGVSKVRVCLADEAWLSIYPYHAPLIAETLPGPLSYLVGDEVREIALEEGILRILDDNTVEVLTGGPADVESVLSGMEDEERMAFDRLARQLMLTLNAEPGGVLPDGDVTSDTPEA